MSTVFWVSLLIGIVIGCGIAGWQVGRRARKDDQIITLLNRGVITVDEAREWRSTGKAPTRLTSGALSPYGEDD